MAQTKNSNKNELAPVSVLNENADGQFTLLPDFPDYVRKARGPVIDSVMDQELVEKATSYLVDDTREKESEKPLPIQTRVMLSYHGIDFDIQGRMKLTAFDREVIDSVVSLAQNNDLITPAMIYRVMMGKKDYQYVTPAQEKRVMDSMAKCAYSKLQLDLTDLAERGSPVGKQLKKEGISASYSGNLLSFETFALTKGSRAITCYRILTVPAIIRYAASLGKISEFPIDLMDTPVSKTERNIVLQSFLLRCIDEMYRGERESLFISCSEVYHAVESEHETRQHQARIRTTVIAILEDWVKKKYISSFKLHQAGKIVKGFKVKLIPIPSV